MGEGRTPQGIPSDKPLINIETSDKDGGATPETNTARMPNTRISSPGAQLSTGLPLESPAGKSSDECGQAGNQKDVRSLADASSPYFSTDNQPPRGPSLDRQSTSLTSQGLPMRGGMPQLGTMSTTGPHTPSMPISSSTDDDSTPGFLNRNAAKGSSTGGPDANKLPMPSRQSPTSSNVQGSLSMPKKVPEPPSLSTTRAPVQVDDTSSRYDGGFRRGPSFKMDQGLLGSNPTNTVPWAKNETEETILGDKTTNPIPERPSSEQQLTCSGTVAANKELKDWGTRTPGDRIRLAGTETSAGRLETRMTADQGRLNSTPHQGGRASNVIGELTRANLQRHEASSQEDNGRGEEDENILEDEPPIGWYEWYKKYHAEQRKERKEGTEGKEQQ